MINKSSIVLFLIICLCAFVLPSYGDDEVDLNLLVSSYEDNGINAGDLATFLTAHGYSAQSSDCYVTVKLSNGKNLYLLPNTGGPGLASIWIVPPSSQARQSGSRHSEPRMIIKDGEIKKDKTYIKTSNEEFIKTIRSLTSFPVVSIGLCEAGSEMLGKTCKNSGYNVNYMVHPSTDNHPGHMWIVVEDPANKNAWLAVDSYFGPMTKDDNYYYSAPYSFKDIEYLKLVEPVLRIS